MSVPLGWWGDGGVGWRLGAPRAHGWSWRLTGAGRSCRVTWGYCPHRCPGRCRGRWGGRGGGGCGCAGSRGSSWRRVRACRTGGRKGAPAWPLGHPGWGSRVGDKGWDPPADAMSLLTCPWGWEGDTPAPPELLAGGEGPPRTPRCHVTAPEVTGAGCPLAPALPTGDAPWAPSPTLVTGSGVPLGGSLSHQCPGPSTYRQRVPRQRAREERG